MSDHIRKRLEKLKSRVTPGGEATISPQPVPAPATANAQGASFPTQQTAPVGRGVASIPIANLPPPFVSPPSAVLKYRDCETDPLCAPFTTKNAVELLEMLVCRGHKNALRRKRARSYEELTKGNNDDVIERQQQQQQQQEQQEGDHQLDGASISNETEVRKKTPVDNSLSIAASYFWPDIAAKYLISREELVGKGETANGDAHGSVNRSGGHRGECILVSGKPRVPCRSNHEYVLKSKIAEGVYGVVYKAEKATSSAFGKNSEVPEAGGVKLYALKKVRKRWRLESQVGFPPFLLREIDLLLRMRHPNIVHAREVVITSEKADTKRQAHGGAGVVSSSGSGNSSMPHRDKGGEGTLDLEQVPPSKNSSSDAPNTASSNGALALPQGQLESNEKVEDVYLVMEYCPFNLKSLIHFRDEKGMYLHLSSRNKHPDAARIFLSRAKCIMQQLFEGLAFLHDHRILHRDIKTSNILIDPQGVVKLCDFGLGRHYREGESLTPTVVTLMYRAPELHFGVCDYSYKMDVWSLGCIMAEIFLKEPLFRAEEETKHFAKLCDILGIPTEESFSGLYKMPNVVQLMRSINHYNRECTLEQVFSSCAYATGPTLPASGLDLLKRIFRWNPAGRPSARQALEHPFFHEEPLPCAPEELLQLMPASAGAPPPLRRVVAEGRTPPPPLVHVPNRQQQLTATATTSNIATTVDMAAPADVGSPPSEEDAEQALQRGLDSLRDAPIPDDEAARCVAFQAQLHASNDQD
ncbi:protein kinase [Trypanosoma grayi]|uniref:protein kinase n=1 Tax=Trypanosoma grayi TaxID=71804 RepID=UPI0004F40933|nr:protein kinase [Trypanosoma grayi]KEG14242.1 protein kinase [Trypanosoma grayi]